MAEQPLSAGYDIGTRSDAEFNRDFRRGFTTVKDVQMHYVIGGRGPETVVLLHGWRGIWYQYRGIRHGLLRPERTVIAVDLPGMGDSTGVLPNYKTTMAGYLHQLLAGLGVWRNVHLVGPISIWVSHMPWPLNTVRVGFGGPIRTTSKRFFVNAGRTRRWSRSQTEKGCVVDVLALGIELDGEGSHPAAWRRAKHAPSESLSGRTLVQKVRAAENAGFTLVTFEDSILPPGGGIRGRVDAVGRASFVAATTSTIGLVPVVETTYAEPFHTSSQLATLDYSTRGRGGWIAARVQDPAAARAWGRPVLTENYDLDREQRDSITVVRNLWDSWEDDAVIRDYDSGRFLDRDKLHYVDFEGDTFTVRGPAIVPRPPQGQLVVFGTEADREQVDVVLVTETDRDAAVDAASRSRGMTFVEISVTLDTADTSAAERLALLNEHTLNAPSSRLEYVGTAAGLVQMLTELATHTEGVRLLPTVIDEDLPALARYVVPALLKSGVAHRPVPGSTLRGNLGLTRPTNRYRRIS